MTDHDERTANAARSLVQILRVVGKAPGRESVVAPAAAMTTQAHGMRFESGLGEVRQEMLVPDPRTHTDAMDKQEPGPAWPGARSP
jgi:hypothetical protein